MVVVGSADSAVHALPDDAHSCIVANLKGGSLPSQFLEGPNGGHTFLRFRLPPTIKCTHCTAARGGGGRGRGGGGRGSECSGQGTRPWVHLKPLLCANQAVFRRGANQVQPPVKSPLTHWAVLPADERREGRDKVQRRGGLQWNGELHNGVTRQQGRREGEVGQQQAGAHSRHPTHAHKQNHGFGNTFEAGPHHWQPARVL